METVLKTRNNSQNLARNKQGKALRNHRFVLKAVVLEKVVLMDTICGGAQGAVTAL